MALGPLVHVLSSCNYFYHTSLTWSHSGYHFYSPTQKHHPVLPTCYPHMASRWWLANSNRIQYYPRLPMVPTARGDKTHLKVSLPSSAPCFNPSHQEPPVDLRTPWLSSTCGAVDVPSSATACPSIKSSFSPALEVFHPSFSDAPRWSLVTLS